MRKWKAFAACALLAMGTGAQAALVVDQVNLADVSQGAVAASSVGQSALGRTQLQTVTAGVAGTLARIDVQAFSGANQTRMQLNLYDGDGRLPGADLLGTVELLLADIPTLAEAQLGALASFDVSGLGYLVAAGQLFSYEIVVPEGRGSLVFGYYDGGVDEFGDPSVAGLAYAGGENAISESGGPWGVTLFDRGFRTFVDDSAGPVPEPATWGLMIVGFGAVGGAMRRRPARAAIA